MKNFTSLLVLLLSIGFLQGENLPLQTVQRTGTYATNKHEIQIRKVNSAKCEAKKTNSNPPSVFQEIKVEGDFATQALADSALATKIATKLGGALYEKTITEYGYTAWEDNSGSSKPVKNGDDSSDDYAKWKKENPSATEVTAEPSPPCDEINAAADPPVPLWDEDAAGKVSRQRVIRKEYKFSYKISFKPASP